MAYMNQDLKSKIAPVVKAILKRYNVKGTLAVRNNSTLVLNIKSGSLDFIEDYYGDPQIALSPYGNPKRQEYVDVNPYYYDRQFRDKTIIAFLDEILRAMNTGNWDKSDSQIDYFDVGWYIDVNIGRWNKPYILEK